MLLFCIIYLKPTRLSKILKLDCCIRQNDNESTLERRPALISYLITRVRELRSPVFWTEVLLEAVASVLLGCFTLWMKTTLDETFYTQSAVSIATFAGLYVCSMVDATGPFDYSMFNPIVTWSFFVTGRISFLRSQ